MGECGWFCLLQILLFRVTVLLTWLLLLMGDWLVASLTAGASTGAPASGVPSRPAQMSLKPSTIGAAGGGGGMFKDMGMLQGVPSSLSCFALRAMLHWQLTPSPIYRHPTCAVCVVDALKSVIHWCVLIDFSSLVCMATACVSVDVQYPRILWVMSLCSFHAPWSKVCSLVMHPDLESSHWSCTLIQGVHLLVTHCDPRCTFTGV